MYLYLNQQITEIYTNIFVQMSKTFNKNQLTVIKKIVVLERNLTF